MISHQRGSNYRRRGRVEWKKPQIVLSVRVSQSDKRPLDKLHEIFGGSFREIPAGKYGYKRTHYEWRVYSRRAYDVLKALAPYLRAKDKHAAVGIAYYEECHHLIDNLERRLEYHAQMAALQVKGLHRRVIS